MTGKWHLSKQPTDFGFDRYWGHLSGKTDFFVGDETFRLNGEKWEEFPKDFYATDAIADWSLGFLEEALSTGKPFFHYVAFNAPHYPLQAPKEEVQKYWGTYSEGWEGIREARFKRQKEMGLFPDSLDLPPMPAHVPAWEDLTETQREFESFRMSIYAGMVDRLDRNVGRLVDFLEEKGVLENTLILFCSDNGACPFERSDNLHLPPWEGESFYLYDASWATVCNTPLKHYKQTQHEGGISSPLIVHWPNRVKKAGGWENSPGHLIDVMATCIDIGSATYPQSEEVEPLQGLSLEPLFRGEERTGHEELYFQFSTCRALRAGNWKAVSFYEQPWELYRIHGGPFRTKRFGQKNFPERIGIVSKPLARSSRRIWIAAPEKQPPTGQRRPTRSDSRHLAFAGSLQRLVPPRILTLTKPSRG